MVYVNAIYELYEYDLEKEPHVFGKQSYECVIWALHHTGADCCYVCCDTIDISFDR